MNDMVDTRTTGTGLAERVCGGFRKDRRELGPEKAADKWFAPLMDRWNGLLSRDGGGFSHEERVTLAVLATEYLSMRDALILAALREMGGGELHMLYARPHSMESAAVVTCELSRAFKDADCQPDMRRWGRATALLESVTADAPDGYEAQPMAACAYLMWMADRSTVAAVRALKALALDDDCSLATLVLAAGETPAHIAVEVPAQSIQRIALQGHGDAARHLLGIQHARGDRDPHAHVLARRVPGNGPTGPRRPAAGPGSRPDS